MKKLRYYIADNVPLVEEVLFDSDGIFILGVTGIATSDARNGGTPYYDRDVAENVSNISVPLDTNATPPSWWTAAVEAASVAKAAAELEAAKPKEVTMRQGREAMIRLGTISSVQPAIDAIQNPIEKAIAQNFWDNSNVFNRDNQTLIGLATALGMTSGDIDSLFEYAATL